MKNYYIKDTKKFDVLDKSNCHAPISQDKTENVDLLQKNLQKRTLFASLICLHSHREYHKLEGIEFKWKPLEEMF